MPWKFQQIEPAVARGTLREELWDDPEWVAEEKYDGDRRIAQFCGSVVRFTGRRKSVKDGLFVEKTENVPHLSGSDKVTGPGVSVLHLPPRSLDGTVLDGEMVFTGFPNKEMDQGGHSKFVTSIMGSLPEEAITKQIERGWLRYVVFDCLFFKGEDVRGRDTFQRWSLALRAVKEWANPFVSVSEQYGEKGEDKRKVYEKIAARGGEGIILKHLVAKYGDRQAWVKVKREWTADVVITGFQTAKKESRKKSGVVSATKYAEAGLIGAVVCGQWKCNEQSGWTEVATVSGMDDDLRGDITNHPKKYLGKVLRIKHNGKEPTGRFRHPRWDGLRSDKSPKDCIFDLEEK